MLISEKQIMKLMQILGIYVDEHQIGKLDHHVPYRVTEMAMALLDEITDQQSEELKEIK